MNLIIDDLDTRVEVSGGGLPILMLHGWKDSLETFDDIEKELKNDYKIIRLDLPGFGQTQTPEVPWSVSKYADFLSEVLLKLEETEIYAVVAHSMGVRIAINALARRTITTEKFIAIAGAGIPEPKAKKSALVALAKGGKVISSVLPKEQQDKIKRQYYKMTGSDYLGAGELEATFKLLVSEDAREYAHEVHAQTLLLYSDNDKLTPVSYGEEFEKLIPNSRLVVVGKFGHNIHKNAPEKTLELIKDFL